MKKVNAWMRLVAVTAVLVCVLWSTALIAAPPKGAGDPTSGEPATREFNFDLDEVTVDVLKPDATMVEVLRAKARRSLIRIRMDFIKEIVRSAEDI
jgi:hypothetical protein